MAEIINEVPDEVEMEGGELEVNLEEGKKEAPGKIYSRRRKSRTRTKARRTIYRRRR